MKLVTSELESDNRLVKLENDNGDVNIWVGDDLIGFLRVEDDKVQFYALDGLSDDFVINETGYLDVKQY